MIADEIYEYFVYGASRHISPGTLPGMKERTIVLSGFSKTFSVTGWRVGYVVTDARWFGAIAYFHDVSSFRGVLPQDSTNFKGDYGQGNYDSRHTFVGEVSYQVPGSAHWRAAATGWQANGNFSFHTGFKKAAVNANWLNPDAFADPAAGAWGTTRRNAYTAPGIGAGEPFNTQFALKITF